MSDYTRHLLHGQRLRFYELHVPSGGHGPWGLVLCFHGGGSYPGGVRWESGWNAVADSHGLLVAYPGGTNRRWPRLETHLEWNDGRRYQDGTASQVDDVGFVRAVLQDIPASGIQYDPRRVYLAGYSNGAQFAYRLAQQWSELLAAVAVVAGQRGPRELGMGPPARPISVLQFSGLRDQIAPYAGGQPKFEPTFVTNLLPAQECYQQWSAFNGCSAEATLAKGNAHLRLASGGRENATVGLWTLEDGGHTWPGGQAELDLLGGVNHDIHAATLMAEFFAGKYR